MTLGAFVRKNRPQWQKLESMLAVIETRGPRGTDRPFLRELSALYRATTGDLAFAQTHYRGTTLLLFLHQLVARAHNQIYRPHRLSGRALARYFRVEIPHAARAHLQAIGWAAIFFLFGMALGLSAVQYDERAASLVLPSAMLNSIYSGHMWTGDIFSAVPASVASTALFTNNITVALLCFAGGLSFGVVTSILLFENGFMLGVAFKLCANYGLLGALFEFIASHGVLEISSIIVAGGAGLVMGHALLSPGNYSRMDALVLHGRSALRVASVSVPGLVVAGCIEAFVSPSNWPVWIKASLGLTLGVTFWLYLLLERKKATG